MSDPRILQRVSTALDTALREEKTERNRAAIAALAEEIFNDPDQVVLGNPQGDVTLVEMFDYNCGYCRSSLPDMLTLMAEDPNLRVVLKEFPILSPGSMAAAQVGTLVNAAKGDYLAFHEALFTDAGPITADTALQTAAALGLDPAVLEAQMESEAVGKIIQKSYAIADALDISGTPTYIIGDEVIPGAIGLEELRQRIANMRACGKTVCPGTQG
jgi:protein-disulfide isomerase